MCRSRLRCGYSQLRLREPYTMFFFGFGLWDTNVVTRSRAPATAKTPAMPATARMPALGGSPATAEKPAKLRKPARSGTQSTARILVTPTAGKNVGNSRVYSNIRDSRNIKDVKSSRTPAPNWALQHFVLVGKRDIKQRDIFSKLKDCWIHWSDHPKSNNLNSALKKVLIKTAKFYNVNPIKFAKRVHVVTHVCTHASTNSKHAHTCARTCTIVHVHIFSSLQTMIWLLKFAQW